MRPSRVTCVASTMTSPAPEYARWPRWTKCQSLMLPSSAEYWHIGETTMRLGSVTPPSSSGVKSSGCGNFNASLGESAADLAREEDRAGLVAVQAQRIGRHRNALAGKARHVALLDHRERL